MALEIKKFSTIRHLSEYIVNIIDCYISRIPYDGQDVISWEVLVQHLGETLDDVGHRKMLLKADGVAKTTHQILRNSRLQLLIKALKEYNAALYVNLA